MTTNGNGGPQYPAWLRTYLVVLVSVVWSGLLIVSALVKDVTVPAAVHGIMAVGMASLFRVEFGGIRLLKKEDEKTDAS